MNDSRDGCTCSFESDQDTGMYSFTENPDCPYVIEAGHGE